jgi:hypothetical protein
MQKYLHPFVQKMALLNEPGIQICPPDEQPYLCRAMLLVGVFDTVARPMVQNFKQFNAKEDASGAGCGVCEHPGGRNVRFAYLN